MDLKNSTAKELEKMNIEDLDDISIKDISDELETYLFPDGQTKRLYDSFITAHEENKTFPDIELADYDCLRLFTHFMAYQSLNKTEGLEDEDFIKLEMMSFLQRLKILKDNTTTKMWKISDRVKALLSLTKEIPIKEELKLPFNDFFIDNEFTFEFEGKKYKLFGALIEIFKKEEVESQNSRAELFEEIREIKSSHDCCYFCASVVREGDNMLILMDKVLDLYTGKWVDKESSLDKSQKLLQEHKNKKAIHYLEKEIRKIILNLLLFLNEPRITIHIVESNNIRRQKKGLIAVPSLIRTKIEYSFEQQIEKIYINYQSHSKFGYSFWVRGHWRLLTSPHWTHKKGQKIWILPHLRGEGIIANQIFEVE